MPLNTGLMDISKTCDDECSSIITKEEEVVVPEDLILEILYRLPTFPVFRFKFVCKSWYSLISNPDLLFLKHHHHHQQQRRLLHHHSDDILLISNNMVDKEEDRPPQQHNPSEYVLLSPPQNQNQEQLKLFLNHALSILIPQKFSSSCRLIDSCNGLLLYRSGNYPFFGVADETTQYHVFNPITKQCSELPIIDRFGNNFRKGVMYWLHIVFDPSVSLSFKVLICFAPRDPADFPGIYVYSSSSSETSSSWKYLAKFTPWKHPRFGAVLLDGFLYLCKSPYKLLCFDVVKDKLFCLSLPSSRLSRGNHHYFMSLGNGDFNMLCFGELGGRLQMIRRYPDVYLDWNQLVTSNQRVPSSLSFSIMELELKVRHNKPKIRNWTVKHVVDIKLNYEDLAAQIIHIYKTGTGAEKKKKRKKKKKKRKMKKGKDEEEEALLFLNKDHNMVIPYNLTSNTFGGEQKISDLNYHSNDLVVPFRFTPTLFPFSC